MKRLTLACWLSACSPLSTASISTTTQAINAPTGIVSTATAEQAIAVNATTQPIVNNALTVLTNPGGTATPLLALTDGFYTNTDPELVKRDAANGTPLTISDLCSAITKEYVVPIGGTGTAVGCTTGGQLSYSWTCPNSAEVNASFAVTGENTTCNQSGCSYQASANYSIEINASQPDVANFALISAVSATTSVTVKGSAGPCANATSSPTTTYVGGTLSATLNGAAAANASIAMVGTKSFYFTSNQSDVTSDSAVSCATLVGSNGTFLADYSGSALNLLASVDGNGNPVTPYLYQANQELAFANDCTAVTGNPCNQAFGICN